MTNPPTIDQIHAALRRAAEAVQSQTRYPDRIVEFPLASQSCEFRDDGWWLIGWIGVVGEPNEWEVWLNPVTDEGRLRAAPKSH